MNERRIDSQFKEEDKICNDSDVKVKESDSESVEGTESKNDSDIKENENDDKNNEREESFDLCIRLSKDQYPLLAQRLYRDKQNMELYDVFRNQVLKHPQVCRAFIDVLKTKSYTELKSSFLCTHVKEQSLDKIMNKRKCMEKEMNDTRKRQEVLVDQRHKRDDMGKIIRSDYVYNIRVISWVIYYGHHQIMEYVVQQMEKHNEINELFRITEKSYFGILKKIKNMIFNRRQMKVEKLRLLLLSCYSGDVQTVRILLPMCKNAVNGTSQINRGIDWSHFSPLTAACDRGYINIVKELVKAGANVNVKDDEGNTALIIACEGGHMSVVEELLKAGADFKLRGLWRDTPLKAAIRGSLSVVKCLIDHEVDWVTQVVDIDMSAVYTALVLNKPDIVKYLIQKQNKISPGKYKGNVHLFNCLVDIRHAGVKTDSRDDVVMTDRSVWCVDRCGYLWDTIRWGDSEILRHLLCVGLDVNQSMRLYIWYKKHNKSSVRPLLCTFLDELYDNRHKTEMVRILLDAGADVNATVRYRECDSMLDREGVSVLQRTWQMVCKYKDSNLKPRTSEYKRVMHDVKKHVRRHSV
jgi:ankyrin repeat protein